MKYLKIENIVIFGFELAHKDLSISSDGDVGTFKTVSKTVEGTNVIAEDKNCQYGLGNRGTSSPITCLPKPGYRPNRSALTKFTITSIYGPLETGNSRRKKGQIIAGGLLFITLLGASIYSMRKKKEEIAH